MERLQVKALLDKIEKYIPVYVIEEYLKMPTNTLQKALRENEKRGLPKKWERPLTDFVVSKKWITINYLKPKTENKTITVPEKKIEPIIPQKENKVSGEDKKIAEADNSPLTEWERIRRKKLGL